jgi:hypothetical protein
VIPSYSTEEMSPMSKHDRYPKHAVPRPARLGVLAAGLLCLGLLGAAPALAAYEEVGNFAGTAKPTTVFGEEVQLGGLGGMAVNYTGAGGVPAGTVYAVSDTFPSALISRYNPDSSFSERWTFDGHPEPEERCGPEGAPAQPVCHSNFEGGDWNSVDVEVDQATGDVYVFGGSSANFFGEKIIHVYSPDGSKVIAEFGEVTKSQSTAESPEKLHSLTYSEPGMIAVNSSGDVYVYDVNSSPYSINGSGEESEYHRLMEFIPQSPGDYEHYMYAGQSHDLQAGFTGESKPPEMPVFDAAGDLYVTQYEGGYIEKLDPSRPSASPLCEFKFPGNGLTALTVNPTSGEVFFFSSKNRRVHQLSADCDSQGEFIETSSFGISPNRSYLAGMTFDPVRQFRAGRPPGVLYAGSPNSEGGQTREEESALGFIFAQPAEIPPTIEAESFGHVTSTTAELSTTVDPKGSATRYVFQYETETRYEENGPGERFAGAMESPLGGAFAGEANEAVSVAGSLAGLAPGTTYRVRVLATSHCSVPNPEQVCDATGEAEALRTFPVLAPGLPDGRAYELVSPPEKEDGEVIPAEPEHSSCPAHITCKPGLRAVIFPMQVAPDGNTVVYEGSAFDSEHAALDENEYIARRGATGWQTTNLTPTHLSKDAEDGYTAFSPDLSEGVLSQGNPALSPLAPSGRQDLYSQSSEDPSALTPLLDEGQSFHRPAGEFHIEYRGASADLSRVFFQANDALTEKGRFAPAAVDGGDTKYNLYESHEGDIALVNVLPGNTATQPGASFGAPATHAISADGSKVFFSDESGQVYLREDGEVTREIGSEGIPDPGKFLVAAVDGSAVLLANGHLHYTEGEEGTVDLTQGKGGFQGVVGESEDLSHVYFVDTEELHPGEQACREGVVGEQICEEAQAGKDNLYAWSAGQGTHFVMRLAASDNGDWGAPYQRTAEASPDGSFLAFISTAQPTGYDNIGPCAGNRPAGQILPGPCPEVFLYDSATNRLLCASCNPSGEQPLGQSFLPLFNLQGGTLLPQPRYLTDDGRLLFESRDSILLADTNSGVEDVYEWEPRGVGSCEAEFADGGCVSLISAGTGTSDSNFLAMDPSGRDVFFTTRDQLSLKDKDDLVDLYDAREGGGIGAETEVARGECQGEACQSTPAPPLFTAPGSATFSGAGNLVQSLPAGGPVKEATKKSGARAREQKLAVALKACRRLHGKTERKRCEAAARKRYGSGAKAKFKESSGKRGKRS